MGAVVAHRDTDTLKWDDPWFQGLSLSEKLLWQYVCDKADSAGIWNENKSLAEFQIGTRIDWDTAILSFGERIMIERGRWVVVGFIKFHYGKMHQGHKMYKKVCECIENAKFGVKIDDLLICRLNDGNRLSENVDSIKDKDKVKDLSINSNTKEILSYSICDPKNTAESLAMLNKIIDTANPQQIRLIAYEMGLHLFQNVLPKKFCDNDGSTEIAFIHRIRAVFESAKKTDWTIPDLVNAYLEVAKDWAKYWENNPDRAAYIPSLTRFFTNGIYAQEPKE